MRRLSLIVVGAAALACWQPLTFANASQGDAKGQERAGPTIEVRLEKADGDCVCILESDYKVHVARGGLVRWTFKNECAEEMSVGIADFRIPERYKDKDKERFPNDKYPLTESCPAGSRVEVGGGESEVLECHIKDDIKQDKITWKYDIVRYEGKEKFVLLDPELEIPGR